MGLVLLVPMWACLMGQGCPGAADVGGGTGDPYGSWSAGLTIRTVATQNPWNEGTGSIEEWTFVQENGQTTLNIVSGSTAGVAYGTLTTTDGGFQYQGECSTFDGLGIHMVITIDATFAGANSIEGTKRTDFYSVSAVWLGVQPQLIGFESATFGADRI
jgi:hypothetical protein